MQASGLTDELEDLSRVDEMVRVGLDRKSRLDEVQQRSCEVIRLSEQGSKDQTDYKMSRYSK